MRMELTKNEMLALWKRRHFLEPLRADCTAERADGIDLDTWCAEAMRRWYLRLLAEAPPELLAPDDLSLTAKVRRTPYGSAVAQLPAGVVRVTAIKLNGWQRAAVPVTPDSPEAMRQANRFARGGVADPVAVAGHDGTLELFSPDSRSAIPTVEMLLAVTDPGEEKYIFDERALDHIRDENTE